jgi:hypothetical protein
LGIAGTTVSSGADEIRPFADADVEAAADLLSRRHERHLAAEALLLRDVDFCAQVEREWSREGRARTRAAAGSWSTSPATSRSVNLLASRFWPRRGWRETHYYRLYPAVP